MSKLSDKIFKINDVTHISPKVMVIQFIGVGNLKNSNICTVVKVAKHAHSLSSFRNSATGKKRSLQVCTGPPSQRRKEVKDLWGFKRGQGVQSTKIQCEETP